MTMFRASFFSANAVLLSANLVCAQTAVAQGELTGAVVDRQGARVITTALRIENKRFTRQLRVNDAGEFKIQLPAGKYKLTAEAPGFHKYRRKIVVASGKTESLTIKLNVIVQKFKKCPPGHLCL